VEGLRELLRCDPGLDPKVHPWPIVHKQPLLPDGAQGKHCPGQTFGGEDVQPQVGGGEEGHPRRGLPLHAPQHDVRHEVADPVPRAEDHEQPLHGAGGGRGIQPRPHGGDEGEDPPEEQHRHHHPSVHGPIIPHCLVPPAPGT